MKENLNDTANNLRLMLESEREQNAKNEDLVRVLLLGVTVIWISNCFDFQTIL